MSVPGAAVRRQPPCPTATPTRVKSRVLIAQGHALLRRRLGELIGALADFEVIGACEDGRQALERTLAHAPELLVTDLFLPGLNGIELVAQIKRCLPQVRIAVLTSDATTEYVRAALRAGADGYILQDASCDELAAALRSVASGESFVSPEVSRHRVGDDAGSAAPARAPWDELTARERSIWKLIAEGHTNRATARALAISPRTVEKHRANLMRKLGLRNVAELMLAAQGYGLVSRPAHPPQLLCGS